MWEFLLKNDIIMQIISSDFQFNSCIRKLMEPSEHALSERFSIYLLLKISIFQFWRVAHLGVGEVNITFNVNPSCRATASEI